MSARERICTLNDPGGISGGQLDDGRVVVIAPAFLTSSPFGVCRPLLGSPGWNWGARVA
ncbi:hypothetical protein [Rhizobium redzepovicii]|uniref:hypothetical protein n=1 Tax=Rhizobium redzepovicii TaxID=2867518 RepID=UPI002870DA54|nr:hypothetical protein [Rhizobium redzepovicii]MDR9780957.1 hypothetical protein [Rhizobium redzepovicii]